MRETHVETRRSGFVDDECAGSECLNVEHLGGVGRGDDQLGSIIDGSAFPWETTMLSFPPYPAAVTSRAMVSSLLGCAWGSVRINSVGWGSTRSSRRKIDDPMNFTHWGNYFKPVGN
jgi:hypothetical protein